MKRATLLLLLPWLLAACEDPTAPETGTVEPPSAALINQGTAYPQIDAQLQRLYDFNNCLSGLPPYTSSANCLAADMTYDAATLANWELSYVFVADVVTSKAQALTRMDTYLATLETAYSRGRLSCRGRYAARSVALTLRAIINAIAPGQPVDLSALPQPLNAPLWTLDLFNGANYNGVPCGAPPGPAFASANGFTLIALNNACNDAGRSLHLVSNEFYITNSAHSNGSLRITGGDGMIWENLTYRCSLTNWGSNNSYGSGPTQVSTTLASPISFNPSLVPCTYSVTGNFNVNSNGPWWVGGTSSSNKLNPGVYCATGSITLSRDNVQGIVTFRANSRVTLTGNVLTLRAFHASGVVLYAGAGSNNAVEIDGSNNSLAGSIYVPTGRADMEGADLTLNGAIVAEQIRLTGARIVLITTTQ